MEGSPCRECHSYFSFDVHIVQLFEFRLSTERDIRYNYSLPYLTLPLEFSFYCVFQQCFKMMLVSLNRILSH